MKFIKNKILKSLLGVSILFSASCTKDFTEINTNPNNPDDAPITNVFAQSLITLSSRFGSNEIEYPASYVGYTSRAQYNDATNYATTPPSYQWTQLLSTFSTNLNLVIEKAEKENLNNTLGAAIVIKALGVQMLVDSYGPVPYFEAGQGGSSNFHPVFDTEKDIYNDLISQLEKANDLFDNSPEAIKIGAGDVLLGNNMDLWKKFGNSMQLRIAIRMSNIDPATSGNIISKILGNPVKYPIIDSNGDNIALAFSGGDWREPWTSASDSYVDIKIGAPLVDILKSLSDPRLEQYASQNGNGEYIGLVIGAEGDDNSSKINPQFVSNETGSVPFMKYTEIEFIKAEAFARNLATGDTKTAYDNAITASLAEYNLDATDYLLQPNVAWDSDIDKLYTQKWIALFRQSWEAWAEMRRTDVPTLSPAINSDKTGHNRTPFRFAYPDSEKSLNGSNIPSNINENDIYWGYQIWWDTRTGVN